MNQTDIVAALCIPNSARVSQRVPKKLLLENGAPTASDKRLITDAIEEIQWLAVLKPNTIGIPNYRDALREYLEIAVLAVSLRGTVKPKNLSRLAELIHRAIPYPVLLLLDNEQTLILSLAHKRWAQNDTDKFVLETNIVSVSLSHATEEPVECAFMLSLSMDRQPQTSIYTLYQGWMECVYALQAARQTGNYQTVSTQKQAIMRRQALADCDRLKGEIDRLRLQVSKEKQLARRVEINLRLKCIQSELAIARQQL